MKDHWEDRLTCATRCPRCDNPLRGADQRILSAYDHAAICMACKREEEQRADYPDISTQLIGQCMSMTEILYGDPANYCFHHFYPFKCQ